MNTPVDKIILLVSDSDENEDLVKDYVGQLETITASFPEARQFAGAEVKRRSYTAKAREALNPEFAAAIKPVLVILDADVRNDRGEDYSSEGTPAIAFLRWLDERLPGTPVLVFAAKPGETVQCKVLARRRTSLWCIGEDRSARKDDRLIFAEALAGLALTDAATRRRYTIEVGLKSARYRVFNNRYQVISSDEIEYRDFSTIDDILNDIGKEVPFDVRSNQSLLRAWGKNLYNLLIAGIVDAHLADPAQTTRAMDSPAPSNIDLRFEIDLGMPEREVLFNLPLELVNHNRRFICSRVPTARNVRLGITDRYPSHAAAPASLNAAASCRVLFVKSLVSRTVNIIDETGNKVRSMGFSKLDSVNTELDAVKRYIKQGSRRVRRLRVIGNEKVPLVGSALLDQLRKAIVSGHYDIVHFAGHSINLGVHGGTCLILPGAPGEALAVKMTSVARWLSEGSAHLMVLSSCEGASVLTAMETMKGGAEGVIGFRWKVDDSLCAEYFKRFYASYFGKARTIADAFCDACEETLSSAEVLPTWASAVAVLRD